MLLTRPQGKEGTSLCSRLACTWHFLADTNARVCERKCAHRSAITPNSRKRKNGLTSLSCASERANGLFFTSGLVKNELIAERYS